MLIEGADYFVHVVPFPPGNVHGAVTPNDDGTYSVYLDSNVNDARRKKSFVHEFNHMSDDHFYRDDLTITEMEAEANGVVVEKFEERAETRPEKFEERAENALEKSKQLSDEWARSWARAMAVCGELIRRGVKL